MKHYPILFGAFFFSFTAFASPMKQVSTADIQALHAETVKNKKKISYFYDSVSSKYGEKAIPALTALAKNEKGDNELRWLSFFAISKIQGQKSLSFIKDFFTHKNWLIRDVAIKSGTQACKQDLGCKERLAPLVVSRLKDSSLIVRTSAVDSLKDLQWRQAGPNLADALFDPDNFNHGKPLWIHFHILEAFQSLKLSDHAGRLVELLEQKKDVPLQRSTIKTLEALTGKSFAKKSITDQIFLWKRQLVSEKTF